jgi:hypothetical protein
VNERQRGYLVLGICALLVIATWFVFVQPYLARERAVNQVLNERSTWTVTMQQYLHQGPLSEQTYRINNNDGKVDMFYSATNRDGSITKQFNVPLAGPQATFLFEALRAEGIWGLQDKPVLPHPKDEYIFEVAQTLGDEGGQRAFGFSDPEFWATTKGSEYPLNMKDPNHPIGVTSRPLRDPHYQKIVQLVEQFGPPSVQEAQNTIRTELAASNSHPQAARTH